jgi:hypothetical protein
MIIVQSLSKSGAIGTTGLAASVLALWAVGAGMLGWWRFGRGK